jgi:hypothetical protein
MNAPLRFFPKDVTTFGEYGRTNTEIVTHGTEKPAFARFEVVDEINGRQRMVVDALYDRAVRKWQVQVTPSGSEVASWTVTITAVGLGPIVEIDAPHGARVIGELRTP